ncbi:MAG: hypothetical protein KAU44_01745, partial [Candidatus Marinimicrobia bacterium]|nr:hypothetical protein [Candidatus Neomarinimicrobiota bacterium]
MRKSNLILLIIIILILSCGNDPEVLKHPLEYTWTIDTLELEVISTRFRPTEILYRSENDIYIFGENGHYNPVYWHYNGSDWQDKILVANAWNILAAKLINGDIYTAGSTQWFLPEGCDWQGSIDKFDNSNVEQIFYAHVEGQRGTEFNDIWGDLDDNIWAGGWHGLLYHYNGTSWVNHSFPDTVHIRHLSGADSSGLYGIAYYMIANKINGYLLKLVDNGWIIEDQYSMEYSDYLFRPFGHLDVFAIDDIVYTCGDGFFSKRTNEDEWRKLWQFSTYKFRDVSGSALDSIYIVGDGGNAMFWDGENPSPLDS